MTFLLHLLSGRKKFVGRMSVGWRRDILRSGGENLLPVGWKICDYFIKSQNSVTDCKNKDTVFTISDAVFTIKGSVLRFLLDFVCFCSYLVKFSSGKCGFWVGCTASVGSIKRRL